MSGLSLPSASTTCGRSSLDHTRLPKPQFWHWPLMHACLPAPSNAPSQSTDVIMSDLDRWAQKASSLSSPVRPLQPSISSSPSSSSVASSASSDDGLTTDSNSLGSECRAPLLLGPPNIPRSQRLEQAETDGNCGPVPFDRALARRADAPGLPLTGCVRPQRRRAPLPLDAPSLPSRRLASHDPAVGGWAAHAEGVHCPLGTPPTSQQHL
eukprot:6132276-Prymnesium_polylepis.1